MPLQVEERLGRNQLRLAHMFGMAWGLRELHAELLPNTPVPPLAERLLAEGTRKCRLEGADQLVDALQLVSQVCHAAVMADSRQSNGRVTAG